MTEIETYLDEVMGDYSKKLSPIPNSNKSKISYYLNLYLYQTIQMVLVSPFLYEQYSGRYFLVENSSFIFFLYDLETDMIIGELAEIDFDENWQEDVSFHIYDAENRLMKYVCPSCSFWLVQRTNVYGHHFLGCSDYPQCNFSCEIDDLED